MLHIHDKNSAIAVAAATPPMPRPDAAGKHKIQHNIRRAAVNNSSSEDELLPVPRKDRR